MRRAWMFLVCALGLVVSLACVRSVTPRSTGDEYVLNGDGCPDDFTYVRAGGSYGGCTFEPGSITLRVFCDGEFNRNFNRFESGQVWRDDESSERGLQVFWPGGDGSDGNGFACVKDR